MEDRSFVIYADPSVYLGGELRDGCLKFESEVYGYIDSEGHYDLDEENTSKLLSQISLDEMIAIGKEKRPSGIIELFQKYDIDYYCIVI